ncbi:NADPH:quinone oxidoreductase family protein [Xanthobacter autotrophicus DSM 431]|uniref:NADPH:quinone oxidoreductase family protein n=1 Tax=Xanthobacter nonsaccharivorans TaxID=3119912 RepID=UPI003728B3C0
MRALRVHAFGPFADATIETVPDPVPGPGEVLIAVKAAETNFPDILVMEGRYQVKPPLPFSPGKTGAGVIEAIGPGVTGFAVGDRVMAHVEHGAFAEKMVAQATGCFALPDGLSFTDAAALGLTYFTAWCGLRDRAELKPGESVLVLGAAGGIGIASIQLAKAMGAKTVIGATRGTAKMETVWRAGADHVIDASGTDVRDRMREDVKAITGGGVDIVMDPVGGALTDAALRALAWRGRLCILGFASGTIPTIKANYLLVKNIAVSGLQTSDYRDGLPAVLAQAQTEIFSFWSRGLLRPIVSDVLPLEDFVTALTRLQDSVVEGKIILSLAD